MIDTHGFFLQILIVGFAFSFFIMLHKGKDSDEVDHFENPWKAFVKTLVLAQGEYQVSIYQGIKVSIWKSLNPQF